MSSETKRLPRIDWRLMGAAALLAALPAGAATKRHAAHAAKPHAAKAPALAPVVSLQLGPSGDVLDGPKSRAQILVTAVRKDGTVCDLTERAHYASLTPKVVKVTPDGVPHPVGDGTGAIAVTVAGHRAVYRVAAKNVKKPFVWSFRNHVISVLSKDGCSMGACHGAAAGKNGFRLTLRGYDPDLDYDRLLHEAGGRRIEPSDPGNSLILKKPTLAVPHAGGLRFKPGSLDYHVIADWIAAGMPGPSPKDPIIQKLEVLPAERTLTPNADQQLVVRAHFSDGHVEDVTNWARYSSNEEAVATVNDDGRVSTKGVGETAITVAYLGLVNFARVSVPFPNVVTAKQYQKIPRANYIDNLVLAKLQKLHILPSGVADDQEFMRRVYLDAIGTLPTADEVRAFSADRSPDKRTKLIDALLDRPEYVDFWTYTWGDLLRINREALTEKGMWAFYSWLRENVANDTPWDKMVHEILTANGDNFSDGPSNFYRISKTPEELTENVSQAFLGIRVQCAHCHNHPFEKWTQTDYYKFASLFSRVARKQGDHPQDLVITAAQNGEINFPKTGKPLPPAPYDFKALPADSHEDRRVYLADWLASGNNTYFVRSIVNRVWRHFMGRGLIEPVDDLRATNPASNEPLMNALCKDLVAHHFDLKYLMREIMTSRTYQLTSRPRPENKKDDRQYSRYYVKRLTAEQLLDAICQVTDQPEKFPGYPLGFRALQLPDTRVANYFLDVFGRPPRQITCDCERAQEPNMAQALHLINGAGVNQKISSDSGFVAKLVKSTKTDPQIVEEMYLACFGRTPTKVEMKAALDTIDEAVHPKPASPETASPDKKPAAANAAKPAVKAKDAKAAKPADAKTAKVADAKAAKPADAKAAKPADAKPMDAKAAPQPKFDPAVARRQVFEDLLWALINGKEFVFNH